MNKEQPKAPVSQVPLQIKTDLTPMQTAIREAIPERFTESGHALEKDFRWTFVRTGPPQVRIQDGLVAVHAEYKGDIETRGGAGPVDWIRSIPHWMRQGNWYCFRTANP